MKNLLSLNPERRAGEIISQILYITIATVSSEGKPWNSPLYSAYDELGNFYWTSSPEAQHSRNIEANGEAFLVIYDSTVPEGTGEGVYIEAIAGVLDDLDEIAEARRHSGLRRGKYDPQERPEQYLPGGVCRVYRARPKRAWMNDDVIDENGCFVKDIRVEIPLTSLTGLVYW